MNSAHNSCYNIALVPVAFYTSASYGLFRFMNIAREWPTLMLQWESVESKLPKWRNQYEKRQLAFNVRMVAIAILLCSLGSYFLSSMNKSANFLKFWIFQCSGACPKHRVYRSIFGALHEQHTADPDPIRGSIITAICSHLILAMESILRQNYQRVGDIFVELYGLIRDSNQPRTLVQI